MYFLDRFTMICSQGQITLLCHASMRGSHPLPDQLPGEHTGCMPQAVHRSSSYSPKNLEISCTGLAIFALSLLLLMISPSIQVVPPKSSEYSMYSIVAADPVVSCKKNRSGLMNFPIIWGFPEREHLSKCEYLWLSQIFGILTEIRLK